MQVRDRRNTPEEEAAIQRGIALDPDSPELNTDGLRASGPNWQAQANEAPRALVGSADQPETGQARPR